MTLLVPGRVGVGVAALLSVGLPGFLPNSVSAQQEGHGIQEFTDSTTCRWIPSTSCQESKCL